MQINACFVQNRSNIGGFIIMQQDFFQTLNNVYNTILEVLALAPYYIIILIELVVIFVVVFFADRIVVRYIRRIGKEYDLSPDVVNSLKVITRFFIILFGLWAIATVGGIPSDWIISVSAIAGAAIGFASTRTIGNFIAGIYMLISKPFHINDYIKIGDVEGIVKEITINYTKILTRDGKTVLIVNQDALKSKIVLFSQNGVYTYSITVTFDHSLTDSELEGIFEKVIDKFKQEKVDDVTYSLIAISRLERKYTFCLAMKNIKDLLTVPQEFLRHVIREWDTLKATKKE